MKVGIKLWTTNNNLYNKFLDIYKKGKVNYLELKYILGKKENLDLIKNNKIPVVIHSQNCIEGVCFSDGNLKKNLKIFKELLRIANYLNSERIIIHPGIGTSKNFIEFLKNINTNKLIIENMPKVAIGKQAIGFDVDEIKEFLSIGNFKFCLDFSHAIKSAISQNLDYKVYIKKFLKLKPFMFHFCDGHSNIEKDEHLNFGQGNFDLKFLKKCIKNNENKMITIETPKGNGLDQDIKNIEYFKNL